MKSYDLTEIKHPTKGRLLVRAGTESQYETASGNDGEINLGDYHVGGGWYDVPGADKKVREAEALRLLTSE
ncbi:MAG: hypothetical protein GVY18_05270 [Bacteroidetes bacterium]|jgi:hypothetical protein|nr:hypothetical protein [Bacteroidota bacterium]